MAELLAAGQAIENVHSAPAFKSSDALASPPDVTEISPSNSHLLIPDFAWLADDLTVRNPVMAIVGGGGFGRDWRCFAHPSHSAAM